MTPEESKIKYTEQKNIHIELIKSADMDSGDGYIIIPILKGVPGKIDVMAGCDADLLKYKMAAVVEQLAGANLQAKIMQNIQDPTEREIMLRQAFQK